MNRSRRWMVLFVVALFATLNGLAGISAIAETESTDWGKGVTLQWLTTVSPYSGPYTGWLDEFIFSNTGVHLELVQASADRIQAALASGDLNDIVSFSSWNDVDTAIGGNMLVNLDEHMDALPNISKNLSGALEYVREMRSAGTGKAYVVPDMVGENRFTVNVGTYAANIRWDIYKAIGAPAVNSIDDLLPVLKQMQDYYPTTADGRKVYAFSLFPGWDGRLFTNAFNYMTLVGHQETLPDYFLDWSPSENDKVTPLFDKDSSYIKGLKFFFEANQLGILDPDSMTQTSEAANEKLNAGAVLAAIFVQSPDWYNSLQNKEAEQPIGFMPVMFEGYKPATMGDYWIGAGSPFAISSSCKDVDAALRLLDFFADYKNLMILYNGPEGLLWEYGDDGKPQVTEKFWDYKADPTSVQMTKADGSDGGLLERPGFREMIRASSTNPDTGMPLSFYYWDEVIQSDLTSTLVKDWADFYGYVSPIKMIEDKFEIVKRPLSAQLMESAPDDINMAANAIGDYIKQYSWQMVYAKDEAEFDKLYEEMLSKAEGLGLQDVMDWAKGAHERAEEKAAKYMPQ